MAKDDAGAPRQPPDRGQQAFAEPLVGHQPEARQCLAAQHGPSYSSRDERRTAKARGGSDRNRPGRRARRAQAGRGDPHRRLQDPAGRGDRAPDRRRPARFRREPGAGGTGQMAGPCAPLIPTCASISSASSSRTRPRRRSPCSTPIHSVDRPSLVAALAKAMAKGGRRPDCFLQVNIGDEPQKGGCAVADLPALLELARAAGLPLAGLMCIPPDGVEPAPYFALLAKLARRHDVAGLSMGMSGDYESAVMIGATHVRVGTACSAIAREVRCPDLRFRRRAARERICRQQADRRLSDRDRPSDQRRGGDAQFHGPRRAPTSSARSSAGSAGRCPRISTTPAAVEDARALAEGLEAVAGAVAFIRGLPPDLPRAIASSSSTEWIKRPSRSSRPATAHFGEMIFSGARACRPRQAGARPLSPRRPARSAVADRADRRSSRIRRSASRARSPRARR